MIRLKLTLSFIILFLFSFAAQSQNNSSIIAKIDSINTLPFVYITSSPTEVEPIILANIALADSIGYTLGLATSNALLGIIYHYLGKEDFRAEHILNAIKLYLQIDSTRLAGYQYTELGYGMKHRNLDLAEDYMMRGLSLLNSFPGSITQADAFNNYGIIKLMKQEHDSALYFITQSLQIKEKENDFLGVSYSLGNLSEVYLGLGEYDEAIKRLNNSYSIRKELKDSSAMGYDLLNLGLAYNKKSDYITSIQYFKQALKMATEINYTSLAEKSFYNISNGFELIDEYDSALFYHKNYILYKDSLLNIATNSRVAELQVQFETEEKEKQIAISNAALSNEQLKVRQKNWLVSILGILFTSGVLVAFLLFKQQRLKRHTELRESHLELQLAKVEAENKMRIEKERISRDLHDNVGSQITNLITGIEISNLHLKKNQHSKVEKVLTTLDMDARNTMTDLRETIWLMDKTHVEFGQFVNHLKGYIKRQQHYLKGLKVKVLSTVSPELVLNPTQSLNLMRIFQEALNNARKYSEATSFSISFAKDGDSLTIELKDNGIGMDTTSPNENADGNGINNMRSRAELIGGELDLHSELNIGTIISLSLPLYPE
tara:strand:- start:11068 stop:12879 length:1812 start_codon:yes stop_codon:yes gene_type:complete